MGKKYNAIQILTILQKKIAERYTKFILFVIIFLQNEKRNIQ